MADSSISSILHRQLDLLGEDSATNEGGKGEVETSASRLLAQKQRVKDINMSREDFIPLGTTRTVPANISIDNPLLSQISESAVDAPKYWGNKSSLRTKNNVNRKVHKSLKKKKMQKGVEYKQKRSSKVEMKLTKKMRISKIKASSN